MKNQQVSRQNRRHNIRQVSLTICAIITLIVFVGYPAADQALRHDDERKAIQTFIFAAAFGVVYFVAAFLVTTVIVAFFMSHVWPRLRGNFSAGLNTIPGDMMQLIRDRGQFPRPTPRSHRSYGRPRRNRRRQCGHTMGEARERTLDNDPRVEQIESARMES